MRAGIESLLTRIAAIEAPARERILAQRQQKRRPAPTPLAAWDFDRGLDDHRGPCKVALQGTATLSAEGLHVDGQSGYAISLPLSHSLAAKTIEAWVRLDNLSQRGGAVISIEAGSGGQFDALVFGEREAGVWMAGSEGFRRYQSVRGEPEKDAMNRVVHVAAAYAADGTIRLFRDGRPYGTPYRSSGPARFRAGEARVLFGLRHSPVGGNRMLAGTIVRARVYDRALTPRPKSPIRPRRSATMSIRA